MLCRFLRIGISSVGTKNHLPSATTQRFSAAQLFKMTTSAASASTTTEQPSDATTPASTGDKSTIHQTNAEDNPSTITRSAAPPVSFVRDKSSSEVLNFATMLLDQNKYITSIGVLLKSLNGVVDSEREMEFVDVYFRKWWSNIKNLLSDMSYPSLCAIIYNLGRINAKTNGALATTQFTESQFRVLEQALIDMPFSGELKHISMLYMGLGNLTSMRGLGRVYHLNKEILSKTFSILNNESAEKHQADALEMASTTAKVLETLTRIHVVLNRNELETLVKRFRVIFDDKAFIEIGTTRADLEFYRKLKLLSNVADVFLAWNIDADELNANFWSSWFAASKGLLINSFEQESTLFPVRPEPNRIRRRLMSSIVVEYCSSAVQVATRFSKYDLFSANLMNMWSKLLTKNVQSAMPTVVEEFYHKVSSVELHLAAHHHLHDKIEDSKLIGDNLLNAIFDKMQISERIRSSRVAKSEMIRAPINKDDFYGDYSSGYQQRRTPLPAQAARFTSEGKNSEYIAEDETKW